MWVDAVALGFAPDSYCDGLVLDEDGYIWSARYACLSRNLLAQVLSPEQVGRLADCPVCP